ncbi:MAG: large subunit ribosomal protein [Thermoplasmata archaeon]|nr:large subunit ribosomal protein [Thermoplasmata archaeon]
MGKRSHPRQGSMGFYPRKRARSNVAHVKAWASDEGGQPKLQGFAGYKAGMTHVMAVDYRPASVTAGQEVRMPVTVIETPPMAVVAVRVYENTAYGIKTLTEVWADKVDERLGDRLPTAKKPQESAAKWKLIAEADVGDIRVLAHTQPVEVTGVDHKIPDLMEIRVGGGDLKARLEYAKSILGKVLTVADAMRSGQMMDTLAITKGYGFESRVVRFHTKLLSHKNSKHRRMIGTQGSWHPNWVQSTVPNDGQRGYHQRTEYNKRILKIGADGAEVTPAGGFPHYGVVRNEYLLVHGSIPGPAKRIIRMRDAVRYTRGIELKEADIRYISTQSKQGA